MPAATLDLLDVLKSVKVDGHQQYEALEIFHLRWAVDGHRLDYLTLDEALETKCIEVAESSQSGCAPDQDHQPLRPDDLSDGRGASGWLQTKSCIECQHDGSRSQRDANSRDLRREWTLGIPEFFLFEPAHLISP